MSSSQSDRNVLFGILALQMEFITQAGLIAALQAWTPPPSSRQPRQLTAPTFTEHVR